MKESIVSFGTELTQQQVAATFQVAVRKRPLKLKVVPFRFFTPTPVDDPFADLLGSRRPDFEAGTIFSLPGPGPTMGSVIVGCLTVDGRTQVMLTSTGNMRGRVVSNSLLKHVLGKLQEQDPAIAPTTSTGHK